MIRRRAATAAEMEFGLDFAQSLLGHRKADMTKRYSDADYRKREKLARERKNPFADTQGDNNPLPLYEEGNNTDNHETLENIA